jgi:HNH endonuclease/AP2 domain
MVKEIKLTQNKVALVDDINSELTEKNWCAHKHGKNGNIIWYVERREPVGNGKRKTILMHRVIMERMLGRPLEKGEEVDHIDHNGLNNQISNLRLSTHGENLRNQRRQIGCSSIYKGVCWKKDKQKWKSQIKINGKGKHLGYFDSEIDAARAYDMAALNMFASFCCLNFPDSNYLTPESVTV